MLIRIQGNVKYGMGKWKKEEEAERELEVGRVRDETRRKDIYRDTEREGRESGAIAKQETEIGEPFVESCVYTTFSDAPQSRIAASALLTGHTRSRSRSSIGRPRRGSATTSGWW